MRTDVMRWVVVVFTTFAVGGCYSNGQWSMPNLAFWKSSPFQSSPTPDTTPGAPGSPVKPSGIAAGTHGANVLGMPRAALPPARRRRPPRWAPPRFRPDIRHRSTHQIRIPLPGRPTAPRRWPARAMDRRPIRLARPAWPAAAPTARSQTRRAAGDRMAAVRPLRLPMARRLIRVRPVRQAAQIRIPVHPGARARIPARRAAQIRIPVRLRLLMAHRATLPIARTTLLPTVRR